MNRFVDVTLPPYQWTRCRKRHNDDLKPHRNLKNPVSVHLYGVLLFLSPHANELRTGIREKNHRGGSLNLCARRVPNPKGGSRGIVAEPEYYGRVSNAGRIGRKEEARHGRMNRQSLQAGVIIDTPPGIPYGFIPMRFDGSPQAIQPRLKADYAQPLQHYPIWLGLIKKNYNSIVENI